MKNATVVPTEFKTKAEKCAFEIISFLLKHEMWQDTFVYVNGKRYTCYDGEHYHYDNNWDCVFREDNKNPADYVAYYSDFLTMTFEGPFYDIVNYFFSWTYCNKILDEFNAILKKYGKYYELGNNWSLALYDL